MRDEGGNLLKIAQSTWEHDPTFVFKTPKAGRYLLTVRDSEFLGGPSFTSQLYQAAKVASNISAIHTSTPRRVARRAIRVAFGWALGRGESGR